MSKFEDNIEEVEVKTKTSSSKKLLAIIVIMILVVIAGGIVGFLVLNKKPTETKNYTSIQTSSSDGQNDSLVLFDLPEINVQVRRSAEALSKLKMNLNIEISKESDVKNIEDLMPKILDIIISHTTELSVEEIKGAKGLYFLREELLYRINLVIDPIKAHNINFKSIEVI